MNHAKYWIGGSLRKIVDPHANTPWCESRSRLFYILEKRKVCTYKTDIQ